MSRQNLLCHCQNYSRFSSFARWLLISSGHKKFFSLSQICLQQKEQTIIENHLNIFNSEIFKISFIHKKCSWYKKCSLDQKYFAKNNLPLPHDGIPDDWLKDRIKHSVKKASQQKTKFIIAGEHIDNRLDDLFSINLIPRNNLNSCTKSPVVLGFSINDCFHSFITIRIRQREQNFLHLYFVFLLILFRSEIKGPKKRAVRDNPPPLYPKKGPVICQ